VPYERKADLPDAIKKLPSEAQDIWRKAYNAAWEQYSDREDREAVSNQVAWAAVKTKFEQDEDGNWVKKKEKAMADKTQTFKGVEIARTGTFEAQSGRVTFTTKDFDAAEEAYEALKGKHQATIKLGHDEHQKLLQEDGYPNAGFIENIHRQGDRLLADLVDVPNAVAELIKSGRYNARSLEAMRNFEVDGKKWPFVITGLALLGADLPAVDSLKDVAEIYASQGLDLPENAVIVMMTQGGYEDVENLISELQRLLDRTEGIIYHRGGAPKFRTLVKAAIQELRTISKTKTKVKKESDMELTKLIEVLGLEEDATEEAVLASLVELKEKAEKASKPKEDPEKDQAMATLRSDLAEAQKRIVALENERATEKARREVDEAIKARKFTPASRDTLIKMATGSPTEFGELVEATPNNAVLITGEKGKDGDGDDLTELEPTQTELAVAAKMMLTREELIEQKAIDRGMNVPPEIAKVLAERRKA